MWYALLLLVTAGEGVNVYTVESIHATQAECVELLTVYRRGEGACVPVEIRLSEIPSV